MQTFEFVCSIYCQFSTAVTLKLKEKLQLHHEDVKADFRIPTWPSAYSSRDHNKVVMSLFSSQSAAISTFPKLENAPFSWSTDRHAVAQTHLLAVLFSLLPVAVPPALSSPFIPLSEKQKHGWVRGRRRWGRAANATRLACAQPTQQTNP